MYEVLKKNEKNEWRNPGSNSSSSSSRSSSDISGLMDAYKTKMCTVDQRNGVPHRYSTQKMKNARCINY